MARKQKITRHVTTTEVEVMLCDTSNGGIHFEYDTFVGKTTEKKAKKKAKEKCVNCAQFFTNNIVLSKNHLIT